MAIKHNRLLEFKADDTNVSIAYAKPYKYGWFLSTAVDNRSLMCCSQARRVMRTVPPGIEGKWRILSAEESQLVLTFNS